jgi:hypothetical protein
MSGLTAAVNNQQVTITDPVIDHAVAGRPHEVGGCRVGNAELVQVDGLFDVVLGRGWEAACRRGEEQGDFQCRGLEIGNCKHDGWFYCAVYKYSAALLWVKITVERLTPN